MKSSFFAATAISVALLAAGAAHAQSYQAVEDTTLTVELMNLTVGDLEDMDVINADGDEVGDVERVLMRDGAVAALAVEVGGFFGIGDKTVVVPLDQLTVAGDDLMTNMTQTELEGLPEWHE